MAQPSVDPMLRVLAIEIPFRDLLLEVVSTLL
jgi:hypothetical protein